MVFPLHEFWFRKNDDRQVSGSAKFWLVKVKTKVVSYLL